MASFLPYANAADAEITSPYGWRVHPISGEYAFHTGVDLSYADRVTTDTVIALSGSTGNVTGPHLHLELWENGAYADPTNLLNDLIN